MRKTWVEIYALAVCFFTVGCFVVVLGNAAWSAIQIAAPDFTMSTHDWEKHQSDEAFGDALIDRNRGRTKTPYIPPEGDALTEKRKASFAQKMREERRAGFQGLVFDLIVLSIDGLLFAFHWRLGARVRQGAT